MGLAASGRWCCAARSWGVPGFEDEFGSSGMGRGWLVVLWKRHARFLGSGHYTTGSRPVKAESVGRGSAGDLGRLAGGVVRGLRVTGGAVLARSHQAGFREAGPFEHREEDLPRHGADNSVGPLGFVRRDPVANQSDIARL